MIFCMNCGKELPDEARFCLMCGKNLNTNTINETIRLDIVKNRGGQINKLKFRAKENTYCEVKKLLDASMENYLKEKYYKSYLSIFDNSRYFVDTLGYVELKAGDWSYSNAIFENLYEVLNNLGYALSIEVQTPILSRGYSEGVSISYIGKR